jgi:hypothetical protein
MDNNPHLRIQSVVSKKGIVRIISTCKKNSKFELSTYMAIISPTHKLSYGIQLDNFRY